LRYWLRQILLNNIRDAEKFCGAKKRGKSRQVPLDATDSQLGVAERLCCSEPSPSEVWLTAERVAEVKLAISRLSEADRIAIEMRSLAGRPFEEIAARLGRSPEAARKLWARAVDRLTEELARDQSHAS
jgi:RNA polymerase sigma-70 factor (ECF subfamily)